MLCHDKRQLSLRFALPPALLIGFVLFLIKFLLHQVLFPILNNSVPVASFANERKNSAAQHVTFKK